MLCLLHHFLPGTCGRSRGVLPPSSLPRAPSCASARRPPRRTVRRRRRRRRRRPSAPLRQCPLQVGSRTIGRVRRPRGQARTKRRRGALTRARRSSRRRQIRKTKPEEIDSFPAFAVPRVVSSLESYPSLPAWARTCACAVRVCVSAVSRLSTCGVSPSASFDPPWTRMRKDGGMGRSASIMESAAPAPG